jgi:putative colanic acid biosynthesis glycosyltransferase
MTPPKYSIITITLNNQAGLKVTAQSIKEQTFKDYEWIIIDGLSTDGTQTDLENYDAYVISEPDNGIYDAMNKGLDVSKGEFIIFMNAGDSFAENSTLTDCLDYDCDLIYGDGYEGEAYRRARNIQYIDWSLNTFHQAYFYRRNVIAKLRYDLNYKIAADYKFTLQFLQKAKNVVYHAAPICRFVEGGISNIMPEQGRREVYDIRYELDTIPPITNEIYYYLQTAIWYLKKRYPKYYHILRNRFTKHGQPF